MSPSTMMQHTVIDLIDHAIRSDPQQRFIIRNDSSFHIDVHSSNAFLFGITDVDGVKFELEFESNWILLDRYELINLIRSMLQLNIVEY